MKEFKLILLTLFIFIFLIFSLNAQTVFINEIHYDNDGTDANEGVELAGPLGTNLNGWQIVGYNGSNGETFTTENIGDISFSDQQDGFGTLWFPISGLQNGAPDGIALVDDQGTVIQFLSYEGFFDATNGPAAGETSTDIGVSEPGAVDESLQLTGSGSEYPDFTWAGPIGHTRGLVNTGQTFTTGPVDNPPVISDVQRDLKVPDDSDDLEISATITDDNGLTVTDLYYSINGGTTAMTAMSLIIGTNVYTVTLASSEYTDGDHLEYWIHAEDNATSPQTTESTHSEVFIGTVDIVDLHQSDTDGVLLYDGATAKVNGIATVANGTFSADDMDVYVQDATSGINVFKFDAVSTPIVIGNDYTVVGTVDQYNGKTEIIPDDAGTDITDNGAGTVPDAMVLTIAELLADPEGYEGMLVQIRSADKSSGTWPTSGNSATIVIDDGTGTLDMRIDSDTDIDESTEGSYPVHVTGIFSQFDFSSPYDEGYQIQPRSVADLDWGASTIEPIDFTGVIKNFKLYDNFPNPFNPNTTIQFDVPKFTDNLDLSVYNIAGQKMVTLYNGSIKTGKFKYVWNGTNTIYQKVPSGIYFAVLKTAAYSQSIKMMLIK